MILLLVLILILAVAIYLFSPSRKIKQYGQLIPGPRPWPLIGNLYEMDLSHEGIKSYYELQKKFGHVIRYWLGNRLVVMLSDPDDAEILLKDTQNLGKADIYRFMHPWLGTGLLTSTGHKWFQRRKAITPTFHFKILDQFIEVFQRKSKTLVECLREKADGQSFNIHPYASRFSLDVICETAMGTSVEAQVNSECPYVNATRSVADCIIYRMLKFWLHPDVIYRYTRLAKQHDEALDIVHGFSKKVISEQDSLLDNGEEMDKEEYDTGIKKRTAFLKLLLAMKKQQNPAFTSEEDIREEVDTFMFEGHDTTASAFSFAVYELGRHPEVQIRGSGYCYKELPYDSYSYDKELQYDSLSEFNINTI